MDRAQRQLASGERWLVKTDPPVTLSIAAGVRYRVRHRVQLDGGVNHVCFRIWAAGDAAPDAWLCDIIDAGVPRHQPRFTRAAFALFQHPGTGTICSDIKVQPFG